MTFVDQMTVFIEYIVVNNKRCGRHAVWIVRLIYCHVIEDISILMNAQRNPNFQFLF